MKGKRVIAGILLVGILATALAGCKNVDVTKKEREIPQNKHADTVPLHPVCQQVFVINSS